MKVEKFGSNQAAAAIQSALIRLGQTIGDIDGSIGKKSRAGLDAVGVPFGDLQTMLTMLEGLLRQEFPQEYESDQDFASAETPPHVIQ